MSDDAGVLDRYLTLGIALATTLGVAFVRLALATHSRLLPDADGRTAVAFSD